MKSPEKVAKKVTDAARPITKKCDCPECVALREQIAAAIRADRAEQREEIIRLAMAERDEWPRPEHEGGWLSANNIVSAIRGGNA